MRKASLRTTLDLQKKRIIFKELSPEDKNVTIALEYDKGHLNDYRLGSAHIKGHFLLSLHHGHYHKPTKMSMDECDDFMIQWTLQTQMVEENTTSFDSFTINPSALALYLAPCFSPGSWQLEIFMKFVSCYWCMDDYIDTAISNASSAICTDSLNELRESIRLILQGKLQALSDIPEMEVPFFNFVCRGLSEVTQDIAKTCPEYEKFCSHFVESVTDWLDSITLFANLMGKNWQSDLCYMTVRRENGQRAIFEIILLLNHVFLDEEIRKSLPFKIFYDAGDYVMSLASDIFSLEQELASGEFSCNMILRKSVLKKLPLQTAVDLCRDMVNDAASDMDQASKDLMQVHPSNDAVASFILEYQRFVDGSLFLYADHKERYGPCRYSIKKVMYEDCIF
jgi:hypothetical protein